jgi:hypothetical protein
MHLVSESLSEILHLAICQRVIRFRLRPRSAGGAPARVLRRLANPRVQV